jgi:hypothetical protein
LFRRAALVVERDDALGWPRQVGDDEADTRVKLARMPFDGEVLRLLEKGLGCTFA